MRRRIVGLAFLTAVLATVIFGLPLAAGVFRDNLIAKQRKLERLADAVAMDHHHTLAGHAPHAPFPRAEPHTDIALYDRAGRIFSGTGPPQADEAVTTALRTNDEAYSGTVDSVICVVPVTHEGAIVGAVRVRGPKAVVYETSVATWLFMLVLAALAVLVSWLVALRLVRHLARPLEHVSAKARRLGEGDFSVRCQCSGIPEIDSLGQALNHTAIRLADLLERERTFSANASHQLRTPLTSLRLALETAAEDRHVDPAEALAKAISAADALEDTVRDLLVLARDTHQPSQPLALDPLLADLCARWDEHCTAMGRALRVVIEPEAPTARASPSAVRQILSVLVDNALIHGSGPVTVTARDACGSVALDVSDEGSCVELDESQLFQRRVEGITGHGIGLALARSLAQAEGGQLDLTGRTPTVFTLFLPAWNSALPGQTG